MCILILVQIRLGLMYTLDQDIFYRVEMLRPCPYVRCFHRCLATVTSSSAQVQEPLNFLSGKRCDPSEIIGNFDLKYPATGNRGTNLNDMKYRYEYKPACSIFCWKTMIYFSFLINCTINTNQLIWSIFT